MLSTSLSSARMASEIACGSKDQRPYSGSHVLALRKCRALRTNSVGTQPHEFGGTEGCQQTHKREFGALLNETVHPYLCMVLLAGCTGLRIGEVMGLRWTGINFESLAMEIREGYARSQVTKLKSECSHRTNCRWIRMSQPFCSNRSGSAQMTIGDWVVPEPTDKQPYDSGSLRKKILKTAALRAKIPGGDRLAHAASLSDLPTMPGRTEFGPSVQITT